MRTYGARVVRQIRGLGVTRQVDDSPYRSNPAHQRYPRHERQSSEIVNHSIPAGVNKPKSEVEGANLSRHSTDLFAVALLVFEPAVAETRILSSEFPLPPD